MLYIMTMYPEFFKRVDESPDDLFYKEPRFVTHIDAGAQRSARELYDELLPDGGNVLDLMSSYVSHLPDKFSVTGLGLNEAELSANPVLDEYLTYDLNLQAELPFDSEQFDGAVCSVSVQYMTRPDDTFREVARILKPDAPFIVTFSDRMFPTKAVLAWRASDDAAHLRIVKKYFEVPGFGKPQMRAFTPEDGDPLYAVWATKVGDS